MFVSCNPFFAPLEASLGSTPNLFRQAAGERASQAGACAAAKPACRKGGLQASDATSEARGPSSAGTSAPRGP